MRRRDFVTTLGSGAVVALTSKVALAGWKTVSTSDGVKVVTRYEGDRQFPTFRGNGKVDAEIADIVAVIQDASRHTDWLHECAGAGELKELNERTHIVYNRVRAPWPVSDRDVVLRGTMDIISETEVKIRFRAIKTKLKGDVDGVVRMPILEGYWLLKKAAGGGTDVEYQVNADPGGKLPQFLVEQASKELPLFTIRNLRKQVKKTKAAGTYADLISGYMARLAGG